MDCVILNDDGTYTTYLGYDNRKSIDQILDDSYLQPASGAAYDHEWSNCIPIVITNNGGELTDYQVRVNLPYKPEMQSDFDDVRFTDSDTTTPIPYWKESYDAG